MEIARQEYASTFPQLVPELPLEEKLYFQGEFFLVDLIKDIRRAKESVSIEVYIWTTDEIGALFYETLRDAAQRGVKVRILVDGIGSFYWTQTHLSHFRSAGIEVKIFRPVLWSWNPFQWSLRKLWLALPKLARRNHRKIFLIDGKIAYTGSINITRNALLWRESGIRISNSNAVQLVDEIFEDTWAWADKSESRYRSSNFLLLNRILESREIRCNQFYRLCRLFKSDIAQRLDAAKQRIWFETPYFVPPASLFSALLRAAKRKIDVRIILPYRSDVPFLPWIANLYYQYLQSAGVKIFEYTPRILHSKMTIVDQWGMIGSSNLNHRSAFSDLELDVVLQSKEAFKKLEQQFLQDMQRSKEISRVPFHGYKKFIAKILFNWRSWF